MPQVIFFSFPRSAWKNTGKKQPPCEKQLCVAAQRVSQYQHGGWWISAPALPNRAAAAAARDALAKTGKAFLSWAAAQRVGVLLLKVICFGPGKHSHSVYYTESKCVCPSLWLCLVAPPVPLKATQLLRKWPDVSPASVYEISSSLHLLATMFHVPWCCLSGFTFLQAGMRFFYPPHRLILLEKNISETSQTQKIQTKT